MTRKQAILQAISVLRETHADEAATVLEAMIEDLPMCHWSEATCFDAIDQWILDNHQVPTPNQFSRNRKLPSHPTIKNRFGMSAMEFLEANYKNTVPRLLNGKTMEEWQTNFIENYNHIMPTSAWEYHIKRPAKTPLWQTIAKSCGVNRWDELVEHFNLQVYYKPQQNPVKTQFNVVESGGIAEYNRRLEEL